MKYTKVVWRKITNEPLLPGDMCAAEDPNNIEQEGKADYSLTMQAIHPDRYGENPSETNPISY